MVNVNTVMISAYAKLPANITMEEIYKTMVVAVISILSVWLGEDYLVDVALVYALLSFLTVVVLSRLVLSRRRRSGVKFRSKEGKL